MHCAAASLARSVTTEKTDTENKYKNKSNGLT